MSTLTLHDQWKREGPRGVLRVTVKMPTIFLLFQSYFWGDPPGVTPSGHHTGWAGTWSRDQPMAFRSSRPVGSRRTPSVHVQVPNRVQNDSSKVRSWPSFAQLRRLQGLPWPNKFSAGLSDPNNMILIFPSDLICCHLCPCLCPALHPNLPSYFWFPEPSQCFPASVLVLDALSSAWNPSSHASAHPESFPNPVSCCLHYEVLSFFIFIARRMNVL